MRKVSVIAGLLVLGACGRTYHTVQLVNATDRRIGEVYIYRAGAAQRGASRAALAPGGTTVVKVPEGNVDVLAISDPVRIDEHSRETRTASQTLELKGPLEIVFHDSNQQPAALATPTARGITFRVDAIVPSPEPPAPE
ncbi:MAG: hypothetical protein M3680_23065 [Myxococcota bacterium]|nr:hypothetical protein [Myxococcota bacterium]